MSQLKKLELSDRVRAFRERAKMSQEQLGKRLGVSGNYVYLIESGKKVPGDSLLKLFETLETSPLYQSEEIGMASRDPDTTTVGVYERLGTETLKRNISDMAGHLPGADTESALMILANIREMINVLNARLRPQEASSKEPSGAATALGRASASSKSDPSK